MPLLLCDNSTGTSGLIMWSRKDVMHPVGPLQPLTIGLIPWGFLWSFLRKYIRCVLTCQRDAGRRGCVCLYSLLLSTSSPMSLAIEVVGSESSGLKVEVSARGDLPSAA